MKARLAGVLAIVFLASFNFPAADAAVKPGLACKKLEALQSLVPSNTPALSPVKKLCGIKV